MKLKIASLAIVLIISSHVFSQEKNADGRKISLAAGKIELVSPGLLKEMSNDMWKLKYQQRPRPTLALSDENGEISLIGDLTQQSATESQLASFKDFQISQLKNKRSDLEFLEDGVKSVNGKKIAYFKFLSQAIDQKVFNYYFFTVVEGKIVLFTFNCIESIRNSWETQADKIIASLRIK